MTIQYCMHCAEVLLTYLRKTKDHSESLNSPFRQKCGRDWACCSASKIDRFSSCHVRKNVAATSIQQTYESHLPSELRNNFKTHPISKRSPDQVFRQYNKSPNPEQDENLSRTLQDHSRRRNKLYKQNSESCASQLSRHLLTNPRTKQPPLNASCRLYSCATAPRGYADKCDSLDAHRPVPTEDDGIQGTYRYATTEEASTRASCSRSNGKDKGSTEAGGSGTQYSHQPSKGSEHAVGQDNRTSGMNRRRAQCKTPPVEADECSVLWVEGHLHPQKGDARRGQRVLVFWEFVVLLQNYMWSFDTCLPNNACQDPFPVPFKNLPKKRYVYLWQCCQCGASDINIMTSACPSCNTIRCAHCRTSKMQVR